MLHITSKLSAPKLRHVFDSLYCVSRKPCAVCRTTIIGIKSKLIDNVT